MAADKNELLDLNNQTFSQIERVLEELRRIEDDLMCHLSDLSKRVGILEKNLIDIKQMIIANEFHYRTM
jgi:hypothetical protein